MSRVSTFLPNRPFRDSPVIHPELMRYHRLFTTSSNFLGNRPHSTHRPITSPSRIAANCHRQFTYRPPLQRAQPPQSRLSKAAKMTTTATTLKGQPLDRTILDGVLRRRMFYTPSFEVMPRFLSTDRWY